MDHQSFHKALEYELLKEQAGALGLAGRKLEAALQRYNTFIPKGGSADNAQVEALLDDIAAKVWELVVQRELIGFRHDTVEWITALFDIPDVVIRRLGLNLPR
jgi:hypothetical protein